MTQSDLAARPDLSLKHVNQVVHGAAPITQETALLLETATVVPARFWNTRESAYRERLARAQDRQALGQDAAGLKQLPIKLRLGEIEQRRSSANPYDAKLANFDASVPRRESPSSSSRR